VTAHPVGEHLRELARLRRENPVLWRGATLPRERGDGAMAISRFDLADRREFLVLSNNSRDAVTLDVPTSSPGASFEPLWGEVAKATSSADGFVTLTIPALSAAVMRADTQYELVKSAPVIAVAEDDFSDLWLISAETSESPQEVSFMIDDGSGWRRLSVDDSAQYRGFVSPESLAPGASARVVAVSRFADGTLLRSTVVTFTNSR